MSNESEYVWRPTAQNTDEIEKTRSSYTSIDMTVSTPVKKHNDMTLLVDFTHPEQCAQTRPVNCSINGRGVIPDKQNWSRLLAAITEYFIEKENPNLGELERKPLYGNKAFFMLRKADLGTCCKLSNGKWIYTNYNPQTIVTIIGRLCLHCEVSLNNVLINYLPKGSPFENFVERTKRELKNVSTIDTPKMVVEPELANIITEVILAHFPNGFKADSPIELYRLRRFVTEDFCKELSLSDEELMKTISSFGIIFNEKVFIISHEIESRIQREIDFAMRDGADIIFYSSFFKRHEGWLIAGNVISVEILKELLITIFPQYTYKANYFSLKAEKGTEFFKIKNEIMRVWGSDIILNYEQLTKRLPYIPLDKIKYVLAQNNDFLWNAPEVYTHTNKVDVADEEYSDIANYVAATLKTNGYASLSDVPLGEIRERNFKLTLSAIQNAIFWIVLADKYDRRSKIITHKGDTLDILTLLKEFCRTQDKCSLDDLLNMERDLTGETYQWIPLEAGYSVMVRVNKDNFIAGNYVNFNTTEIDNVLDLFVLGEYLPLKNITTFASFPYCGQVWNLFLLESYCRRFSKKFRFEALSLNSSNSGVIVRKSCRLSYGQILADAVAKSTVSLEIVAIIEFLRSNGYIGRRSYAKIDELIEQARTIREGMD